MHVYGIMYIMYNGVHSLCLCCVDSVYMCLHVFCMRRSLML